MIKAESKGGERTLRSASPHRNAYKSDFHAIKCSFDGSKSELAAKSYANGSSDTREDSRGRPFGTRVNKIKNIFLQMDGQQQECQEGKATLKSDVPQVSPTKVQFPVNTHRVNFNSSTSPESHNLDKTPKGEDVEIDKVALAEKFSVTRKLFERGIKEQPAAEKQPSNRVVTRLSLGSASDEGKSTRRVSGSLETIVKSEQTPTSATECRPDERADREKRHVSRVSLNAGPISKRLGNYMAENEPEDNNTAAAKGEMVSAKQRSPTERLLPTSPTRDSFQNSSVKETTNSTPFTDAINKNASLGSSVGPKPTFPATNAANKSISPTPDATNKCISPEQTTPVSHSHAHPSSPSDGFSRTSVGGDEGKPHSPPPRDGKQPLPSAGGVQNTNRGKYSERARSNDSMGHSPTRDKPPSHIAPLDSKGVGMVRAELVVVKNESSESDENEDDNIDGNVFEERKAPSYSDLPTDLKRTFPLEKLNCSTAAPVAKETQRIEETVGEGRLLDDNEESVVKKEKREDSSVNQDGDINYEEDEEVGEEENEHEEQVGQSILDRASPVVYGIENAAFVDDRDVDHILREEEEEEEEDEEEEENQLHREYDVCYEVPGLSDEEEPPSKRKIKFSSDPILVSILYLAVPSQLLQPKSSS